MADFVAKPPKRKNALNNPKLRLSAPNPQAKGIYASLAWDLYQNNPRLVVDTKDPNLSSPENSYGRITAALDPVVFGIFLQNLQDSIASDKAVKFKVENYNHEFSNGQRSQEIVHLTDLWVGKDAEGQVFVSVVSKKGDQWPVIKFVFGPSDQRYHKFFKGDGTQFSKAELSVYAARAYYVLLSTVMASVMDTHYYEAPPNPNWKKGGGGNFGSGGNRPYVGGGGGYNKPTAAAPAADDGDSDIPF